MMVGTNLKVNRENDNEQSIAETLGPGEFVRLYRKHYDAVFRYCAHRLFERHTAEDVASTVFLKAIENFHKFRGSRRQFRNWLYAIATAACNDYLRKKVRQNRILRQVAESSVAVTEPDESADENSRRLAVLKKAMLGLKPRYQAIITLRFFENLKSTEIAEIFGCSSGTVRSQLARGLSKLRKKMAAEFPEI